MSISSLVGGSIPSVFSFGGGVPLFHLSLVWRGVVSQLSLGPDILGIILLYDVLHTWHVFIHTDCCCRCCCCCSFVFLYCCCCCGQRLLFVIVCRMAKIVAGSLSLIPSSVFFSLHSKHDLFLMYVPLGSTNVAFAASICLYYILGNYGHARSQGGRQPAAANPPL